jgi:PKD repeat protein
VSFPLHLPRARPLVLAIACAAACLAALIGSDQSRAAGWLPLTPATDGTSSVTSPRVAVDDAGNVYAAWIQNGTMEVSKRPVGGVFETPQALDAGVTATSLDIGVDGAGNAVVVWRATPSIGGPKIRQARRAAGAAAFGAPADVPSAGAANDLPRLAVNRAGEAVVAWKDFNANDNFVRVLTATSTTAFSGATTDFNEGPSGTTFQPDVAINEAGDAVVAWRVNTTSSQSIDAGYRVHGTAFGPRESLIDDFIGKFEPSVGIDSQGNAVAVWDESLAANGMLRAWVRAPGVTGMWSKLNDLDAGQSGNAFPVVTFDAGRTAVAAWAAGPLRTSTLAPGGGQQFTQPPQPLTDGLEKPVDLSLEAGAQGTSVLGWAANAGQNFSVVRAAARPNAGVFGPIATLTPAGHGGGSADVAVDAQGNAAAVWVDSSPPDANTRVVTAEYDTTAPQFTTEQVPDTATVGQAAAFSAAAVDDWSQPTIGWSFGDGDIAFGDAVTHTYAAPGTYTVTATAVDAGGNTASFMHTVTVSEPPPEDLPTRGVDFNASSVSGTVLVSTPKGIVPRAARRPAVRAAAAIKPPHGYTPFRELGKDDNIPVGSILDASKGISSITMAASADGTVTQTGKFSEGVFKTKQSAKMALTTTVMMGGGNFKRDCRNVRAGKSGASEARTRPHRRLFSNVRGRFRTRGRNSTATVRGTRYLVKDSCRGTLTSVRKGSVRVFDLVKHKGHTVKAGKSYLARPKSALKKRRRR